MRTSFAIALTVPLLLVCHAEPASAQNYPWCAQLSVRGGARNCGFVSWEQCMATVRGIGGFCEQNFMYRPWAADPPVRHKVRRSHG